MTCMVKASAYRPMKKHASKGVFLHFNAYMVYDYYLFFCGNAFNFFAVLRGIFYLFKFMQKDVGEDAENERASR